MNTSLGALVRHRRRSLCLTQAQLAQRMASRGQGIDVAYLESGLAEHPQPATLIALAAALDCPLGILDHVSGGGTAVPVNSRSLRRDSAVSFTSCDLDQLARAHVELKALRDLHTALQQWMDDLEARIHAVLERMSSGKQQIRFDD